MTLAAERMDPHHVPCVLITEPVICLEGNGRRPSHKGDGWSMGGAMYTLNSTEVHAVCVLVVENHPADSRVKIHDDGICQSLTGRMGTGGGNVPLVLIKHEEDDMLCREEIL